MNFQIAADGASGVVVSLDMLLCGIWGVFVQRLNAAGAVTEAKLPTHRMALAQNYPNPFNPMTVIAFHLPEAADIALEIYDVSGRSVARIAEGRWERGPHEVVWDGRNGSGVPCAAGIYFASLRAGSEQVTRKMVLIR